MNAHNQIRNEVTRTETEYDICPRCPSFFHGLETIAVFFFFLSYVLRKSWIIGIVVSRETAR